MPERSTEPRDGACSILTGGAPQRRHHNRLDDWHNRRSRRRERRAIESRICSASADEHDEGQFANWRVSAKDRCHFSSWAAWLRPQAARGKSRPPAAQWISGRGATIWWVERYLRPGALRVSWPVEPALTELPLRHGCSHQRT